jgi:hypothetical protein
MRCNTEVTSIGNQKVIAPAVLLEEEVLGTEPVESIIGFKRKTKVKPQTESLDDSSDTDGLLEDLEDTESEGSDSIGSVPASKLCLNCRRQYLGNVGFSSPGALQYLSIELNYVESQILE